VYQAGEDPENLQVHVTGPNFNALEIYFKGEFFARRDIEGARDLHLRHSVILARQNPYGTFAVRYGDHQDTFRVYGWKKTKDLDTYGPITPEPGSPVCLCWVTQRILKVTYGVHREKTLILEFNGDLDPPNDWVQLFPKKP
jgi:hypothetical protein